MKHKSDKCANCGQSKESHCIFEVLAMPSGCVCEPGSWGEPVTPICTKFVGDSGQYCGACDHDQACHKISLDNPDEKG